LLDSRGRRVVELAHTQVLVWKRVIFFQTSAEVT